jgi:hypothetical protein
MVPGLWILGTFGARALGTGTFGTGTFGTGTFGTKRCQDLQCWGFPIGLVDLIQQPADSGQLESLDNSFHPVVWSLFAGLVLLEAAKLYLLVWFFWRPERRLGG